jgi:hypothetical protein
VVAALAAVALVACAGGWVGWWVASTDNATHQTAAGKDIRCGTKTLYGKTLPIFVVGKPIPCSEVQSIIRGRCRDGKTWSCFSFRAPDPLLVWFPERERFNEKWSTAFEARRDPCRGSRVTAAAWADATRSRSDEFPTRMQVLADDLIRCKQLRGTTYPQVQAVLGRPAETEITKGKRHADWPVGLERDSFFQIDSEYLSISFRTDGVMDSITFQQG